MANRLTIETKQLEGIKGQVRACKLCEAVLPHQPNPVIQGNVEAKILVAGQAPGRRVHASGIPFDDPSGVRLRQWMGLTPAQFYDESLIAIIPMGFCYPGTGTRGDLPPLKICAKTWHEKLLRLYSNIGLTLAVGKYAQDYHLGQSAKSTLTETVSLWQNFTPGLLPLPHPSPRNNLWLKKNPWFEKTLVPYLQERVRSIIS